VSFLRLGVGIDYTLFKHPFLVLLMCTDVTFRQACCTFFGLSYDGDELLIDSFWNVSKCEIYGGLFEAFENDWKLYIPDIKITGTSLLTYANTLEHPIITKTIEHKDSESHKFGLSCGLVGKIGSGKTTVAEYLCRAHGYVEYSFAQPLKRGLQLIFRLSDAQIYGAVEKNEVDPRWGVTPRYLLQQIGTELFRNNITKYIDVSADIWIQNFHRWLNKQSRPVVVSDCRFQDELDALRKAGINVYRIIRPNNINFTTMGGHSSETQQDMLVVDKEIINSGTIEQLWQMVEKLIN